jgi:hypothetical protein
VFYIAISLLAPIVYAAQPRLKPYREGTTRLPIGAGSLAFVRIAGQLARRDRLTNQVRHRKAWRAVRRELARGDLTPEEEMYALDSLVIDGLLVANGAIVARRKGNYRCPDVESDYDCGVACNRDANDRRIQIQHPAANRVRS